MGGGGREGDEPDDTDGAEKRREPKFIACGVGSFSKTCPQDMFNLKLLRSAFPTPSLQETTSKLSCVQPDLRLAHFETSVSPNHCSPLSLCDRIVQLPNVGPKKPGIVAIKFGQNSPCRKRSLEKVTKR